MLDYEKILCEIEKLKRKFCYFNIGKTSLNQNIVCFKLTANKNTKKNIVVSACFHAREFVTSYLLCKQLKFLNNFYLDCNVYFIPLVNVDGVNICSHGIRDIKNIFRREKINFSILQTGIKNGYKLFKSNANCVDINTNFDALWGNGKNNLFYPSYQNFVGYMPNSERETKALISLINVVNTSLVLCYHSKGEVVYYGFKDQDNSMIKIQKKLLKCICKNTGYKGIFTKNSCGGFKDYCIIKRKILGFTIEVGSDKLPHPIKKSYLPHIFKENMFVVQDLLKEI